MVLGFKIYPPELEGGDGNRRRFVIDGVGATEKAAIEINLRDIASSVAHKALERGAIILTKDTDSFVMYVSSSASGRVVSASIRSRIEELKTQ